MIRYLYFILFIFIVLFSVVSQSDFEEWKKQQEKAYSDYRDKNDKAFLEFLKAEWKEFSLSKGIEKKSEPKPIEPPAKDPEPILDIPKENIIKEVKEIKPEPVITIIKEPEQKKSPELKSAAFSFYGNDVEIYYHPGILYKPLNGINQKSISDYWDSVSKSDYKSTIDNINKYTENLNLNDWAKIIFIRELGLKIYSNSSNLSSLFTWFVLSKNNYDVKIGYTENKIHLLVPSKNILYNTQYFVFNKKQYYMLNLDKSVSSSESIYTYEASYPGADKSISLVLKSSPVLKEKYIERKLKFNYEGKNYEISVKYNEPLINFYNDYPFSDFKVYFNSASSAELNKNLTAGLKPLIQGKSEGEAANLILHFVQKSFQYKTDDEQFGKEKWLFPDETVHYKYSDCEDRSIFYSYIIRNMLGLKTVALLYPGHLAVAVKFSSAIPGDKVIYKGEEYLICDPTYINANIGSSMPSFKRTTPEIIELD